MPRTHEVTNQAPPLTERDVSAYPPLREALHRHGAGWAEPELREMGEWAGGEQAQEWGRLAEAHPPVLRTHDRFGNRIDEVEFHPHWHDLMRVSVAHGTHATPWYQDGPGVHVARAAKLFVQSHADPGHLCPLSMTYAAVPALQAAPDLAQRYGPLLGSTTYDPVLRLPDTKPGLIAGMSMTEKQGGSDVRANTTAAVPDADGTYRLTGHKWFTSAPMSDMFLTLAQAPGGLTCFLLPRVLPDGSRNALHLQRLKDKLGNRSNVSSEIEYDGAVGWRVGDEGRGVPTIIRMVNLTRLDCVLASAAGMANAVALAVHHTTHRSAFGARLVDQPLMTNVLADLAIEAEAATVTAMRLAGAVDAAERGDGAEATLRRLGIAVTKYWVCKRAPAHAAEALECLGGNGYVEESGMPRLFREAPLPGIWEGSGNVAALDTLRAMARQPEVVAAFFGEVELAAGADTRFDDALARVHKELTQLDDIEFRARRIVESMAKLLQGSLLLRHGHPAVAAAFCASRLDGDSGLAFGTLPTGLDTAAILDRARPR